MRYLDVATEAARAAGALIRRHADVRHTADAKSAPNDLVTAVDREAEAAIRQIIARACPGHAVLGEEEGGPSDGAEWLWIIDPLDGTNNFVQTLPYYAVSVALAWRGETLAGVLYDPVRDELFTAEKGGGAHLNGRRIGVDPAARLSDAIISTRTPYRYGDGIVENLEAYVRAAARCRSVRNLGAAALEMAWVACGRLTGYWEMQLNSWDRAAGALLVEEAGGRVSSPNGSPLPLLPRGGVLATNGLIHDELVRLIAGG